MSHHHQPLYLCECVEAKEIVATTKKPSPQETQQEINPCRFRRQRVRNTKCVDQALVSVQASEAKEQLRVQKGTTSIRPKTTTGSFTTAKVEVCKSRYELEATSSVEHTSVEIKHSTHIHCLSRYRLRERDEIICKICELSLVGSAYGCENCGFFLHKTCFNIPQEIKHNAHSDHPLTLHDRPTYSSGRFLCNACRDWGYGFEYQCAQCKYDLHVACAALPRCVYRNDLKYPLNLCRSSPKKNEDNFVNCEVCRTKIAKRGFVYCNEDVDCVTHLDCAFSEACTKEVLEDYVVAMEVKLNSLKVK